MVVVVLWVLWDGTGLNIRTGIDKTVSSCCDAYAVRVVAFRSTIDDCTGVLGARATRLVLARYGCSCTTVAMTIMRTGTLVLLLLLSGISVPGVLLAIPWLVLLWHVLGLGGVQFASCFIEVSTKLVRGDVPLLFVVAKIGARCGASFVELFDMVLLVRMVVRMGF